LPEGGRRGPGARHRESDFHISRLYLLVGWFAQYPLSHDCQRGAGTCNLLAVIFSNPHYIAAVLGEVLKEVAPSVGEYQRPTLVLTPIPSVAEATNGQRIPI
jgi:hypothetical protein